MLTTATAPFKDADRAPVAGASESTGVPVIRLNEARLDYAGRAGRVTALDGVSLSIGKGSLVAVVGPSGCGKSSLMKLVSGLAHPTSGEVRINGDRVAGPVDGIGMAFQNPVLMPWRTAVRNVMLPLEIVEQMGRRLDKRAARARATELLELVGLTGFGERYPWELSGGMQQRANLCRALVHDPKILLLDEPFAALDAFTKEELWVVLQDIWLRLRFTGILITHDLREAVHLADVVYVMSTRPGRIVHTEIIGTARPRRLSDTYRAEFGTIVQKLREIIAEGRTP